MIRIIGIDPGLAITGWSVVEFDNDSIPSVIDYGCITTKKGLSISSRLNEIYLDILELVEKYKPEFAGMETLLFYNNQKTAIAVGEARGVVLLALEKYSLPLKEMTPLQVKSSVTGYGKAKKKQVQEAVKMLCNMEEIPKPDDAADAIAVAIATEVLVSRNIE
ncbi:MAG TPA: crossover junction endodeoxyribonuclease RuvC [Candidatus Dojkabacteria bacterium]|jgi:crossover junction endodeoxyribonuclease RuvC|nr:crossover junction endodeoxyribonuclease RuvC [Candidatus Dojkabacteria bacterium]